MLPQYRNFLCHIVNDNKSCVGEKCCGFLDFIGKSCKNHQFLLHAKVEILEVPSLSAKIMKLISRETFYGFWKICKNRETFLPHNLIVYGHDMEICHVMKCCTCYLVKVKFLHKQKYFT